MSVNANQCRNLVIPRKTTKSYALNFQKAGQSVDITGWTIYFTVKSKMSDTDSEAVIAKDVTSHYEAKNGKTMISLTTTDTDRKGDFYYDIKYKDDDGNAGILYHGRLTFRETVTTRG